jgi:hypothetical protein
LLIHIILSGYILKNGNPLKDVVVELNAVNGTIKASAISNEQGYYEIVGLPNDKYEIIPHFNSGYGNECIFNPPSRIEIINDSNKSNINFELNTFNVDGYAFFYGNSIVHNIGGLQRVKIYLNNIFVLETENDGHFGITNICPQTYKIEPYYYDSNGYRWSFEPPYQMVTVTNSNVEGVNFDVKTHMIDGWITTENGTPCNINNISLNIRLNGYLATSSSPNNCFWQILGVPNGYYSIRAENPSEKYYCF